MVFINKNIAFAFLALDFALPSAAESFLRVSDRMDTIHWTYSFVTMANI
jgi:hypothetical protein